MSIFASILRSVYKLSGAKKAFALPEDALRKEIEKQNRHRGVFTPTERAILYFFGGGMVIGPDKGDLPVMRKLCRETGCDVWFPFYPLCMEHCITETYAMVYECYRKMITLYGGGNVSTCGFSSGGALALEIGWQQREAVTALLAANGWTDIVCRKDFGGNDRCVMARKQ